jgi:hypothetical protein
MMNRADGASLDENLGRLRRQYAFAITEARDAVAALLNERKYCTANHHAAKKGISYLF